MRMERLTHERNNGIKQGYWSPATKEELVQRLAAYENTGYAPEELVTAQNAALQAAMDRLGMFGQLFMDYKGCPRGPMGRMAGVSLVDEALSMPEIVDVDGGRWIPVQADVLHKLCEQAKSENGAPERHGRWIYVSDEFAQCSMCKYPVHTAWSITKYCPNCGAKMGEEANDG